MNCTSGALHESAVYARGKFPKRPDILLRAEIELASPFVQLLLDPPALLLMLLPVLVLTFLVAVPDAPPAVAALGGVALLFARRAHL